jgi:hypothetical protein
MMAFIGKNRGNSSPDLLYVQMLAMSQARDDRSIPVRFGMRGKRTTVQRDL